MFSYKRDVDVIVMTLDVLKVSLNYEGVMCSQHKVGSQSLSKRNVDVDATVNM